MSSLSEILPSPNLPFYITLYLAWVLYQAETYCCQHPNPTCNIPEQYPLSYFCGRNPQLIWAQNRSKVMPDARFQCFSAESCHVVIVNNRRKLNFSKSTRCVLPITNYEHRQKDCIKLLYLTFYRRKYCSVLILTVICLCCKLITRDAKKKMSWSDSKEHKRQLLERLDRKKWEDQLGSFGHASWRDYDSDDGLSVVSKK